ncbi:multiple epidermal growth factor-like domains protein 11 isoform X2 [Littorina saxatilis]|uniref:multiple epidermal growth factor-like domains protein 11 isoform X2 n=1 Tax=Littorina saxatilis TaxID=31220 RepID=UPI0038B4B07D
MDIWGILGLMVFIFGTCDGTTIAPTTLAPCGTGQYRNGLTCSACSVNCLTRGACDRTNGHCTGGCASGYDAAQDPKCSRACTGNKYGQNCANTCGKCFGGVQCSTVTGACSRCAIGYKLGSDKKCTYTCDRGAYGQDCRKTCGHCLILQTGTSNTNDCNEETGHCKHCEDNREWPLCEDCKTGFWGPRCLQQCGQCGGDGRCNPLTGVCTSAVCKDGWLFPSCSQKCNEGWYGQNCTKACGHCRDNSACRHDDGICKLDCEDDYEGVLCQEEKQNLVGPVVGSVMAAAVIIAAAIIIVGVLWYVRRKKTSSAYNGEFNTLADLHSPRRTNDTIRRSRDYPNVHDNPASNYDSVVRNPPDSHNYDSHPFPPTAASVVSQSDPVYQNADAQPPVDSKPTVALKPPKGKKLGQMTENTYGNVRFGATTDGTYGNVN